MSSTLDFGRLRTGRRLPRTDIVFRVGIREVYGFRIIPPTGGATVRDEDATQWFWLEVVHSEHSNHFTYYVGKVSAGNIQRHAHSA